MKKNENFKSELETQYNILIKAEEREQKRRTYIILAILTSTLIAVIISLIFSYNSFKNLNPSNNKKSSEAYYRTLSTTYNNTSRLDLVNISTGYELQSPKIITITNEGNTEITYNIKIVSINTGLLSTNNLEYTLTKNNETSVSKELPLQDTNIISNVKIGPKETNTYVLSVKFNGFLDYGVNYNYSASVVVEQSGTKANLLD
jgi:hypothetical protein